MNIVGKYNCSMTVDKLSNTLQERFQMLLFCLVWVPGQCGTVRWHGLVTWAVWHLCAVSFGVGASVGAGLGAVSVVKQVDALLRLRLCPAHVPVPVPVLVHQHVPR